MHSIIFLCTGHHRGSGPLQHYQPIIPHMPEEADRVLLVPGPSGTLNKIVKLGWNSSEVCSVNGT